MDTKNKAFWLSMPLLTFQRETVGESTETMYAEHELMNKPRCLLKPHLMIDIESMSQQLSVEVVDKFINMTNRVSYLLHRSSN